MSILTLASLLLLVAPAEGVIVESVGKGMPADAAGIRAGDVLASWRPAPGREGQGVRQGGRLSSPFDLEYVEIEMAPRLPVVLSGERDGRPIEITVEGGEWKARSRPVGVDEHADFEMVEAAAARNDWTLACWLSVRRLEQAPPEMDGDDASDAAALAADTCASADRLETIALAQQDVARAWQERHRYAEAEAAWRESLRRWEDAAPRSLGVAAALHGLGSLFWDRGLPNDAEPYFRRALALRETLAPDGLEVAATLHGLGRVASWQTDLPSAAASLTRALDLRQRLAPRSLLVSETLRSLAGVVSLQGDYEAAQDLMGRALASASSIEPGGSTVGTIENDLGNTAWIRGDVATAEVAYRRALAIGERLDARGRLVAVLLNNLANVAMARGDMDAAEALYRRAVSLLRLNWPDALVTAGILANYGDALAEQGRYAEAQAIFEEAIGVGEKAAPHSETFLFILTNAAELSHVRGDQASFERYVARIMELAEKLAPTAPNVGPAYSMSGELALSQGKLAEAEEWLRKAIAQMNLSHRTDEALAIAYRRLAKLEQKRGRGPEAAEAYRKAVDALEGLRVRLGGSGSGRLGFGVRHVQLYQEAIEALVETGRPKEAFQYWERSRARALLEMLAERDLALDAELPPDLRRRRRSLNAEYDRTQAALAGAPEGGTRDELLGRLSELERQREAAADEARHTSRRLDYVEHPQPLDVAQARSVLDPGTALLAYSVGPQRTVLFVLDPGRPGGEAKEVEALVIPLGSEALRLRIAAWRRLTEGTAPPPAFFAEARALYDVLVRPAEPFISSARRLVICPDGPLHQLPFAALRRKGAYFVQWKPLTLVPSASVLEHLVRSRSDSPAAPSLVALGDPRTPGFPRLAGSRREVTAVTSLFPGAKALLGPDATKPQMEAAARGVRYVHFAGHGVLNERQPLESALAFTPAPGETGPESGLLHAWEVFERLRLDADLVTLSACRSAAGKELAGEGMLGLTRAFHYAGARSVMASLWRVPDKSTPVFMRRFYGSLKRGLAKDEALRRAQLASIREGQHPVRWASFQLYGDWR